MNVKSATWLLFWVFAVEASEFFLDCNFDNGDDCGFSGAGNGLPWQFNDGSASCSWPESTSEDICEDLISPIIDELSDGQSCLYVTTPASVFAGLPSVYMQNSSSSYFIPAKTVPFGEGFEEGITELFVLNFTSCTQVFLRGKSNPPFGFNYRVLRLRFFRCPQLTSEATTTATTQAEEETAAYAPGTTASAPETMTSTPETTTLNRCDVKIGRKCFKYFNSPQSYHQAQETCVSHGGRLPVIKRKRVMKRLRSEVKSKNLKMWVGATDLGQDGVFVWDLDNDCHPSPIPKSWWIRGEPNKWRGNENCVMMKPPTGKFNDSSCGNRLTFFCQL